MRITQKNRTRTALVAIGLVLALLLAACGGPAVSPTTAPSAATTAPGAATAAPTKAPAAATTAPAAGTPKPGGTLTIGMNQDAVGFDPHLTNATASYRILENIYSGLLKVNERLEVQPDLAESYTADSPTQYTFKLRKGVKFHSGREFKSADVKYSLERIRNPDTKSPRATQFAALDTIETPDDYTVVIKLKRPYSPLLTVLADRTNAIVAKETVDANGGKMDKVANGTGPFKLVEYTPNTRTVLEKNPDYFIKGQPLLDKVIYQPIPDATARSTAVRTGTVDIIEYAPPKDLTLFRGDPKLAIAGDGSNNNVRYLAFNTTVKPFDNPKVRQAIAWAVDRKAVLDAAENGAGKILDAGPFLPSFWPGLQQPYFKQDIAKAKQLLTEAGYPSGFTAKLKNTPTYSFLGNAGIAVQDQLKAVGVNLEIESLEWSVFLSDYLGKKYEAVVSGYSAFMDPDNPLDGTYVSGRQNNFMSYSNPKFDELVAKGSQISDQAERAKIYRDAQQILIDDSPMVFLFASNEYEVSQTYVKGYMHYLNGSHVSLRNVWLDKGQ
ncbi:MAG: ABC transporter substrate-binding protein [Chloroflexi bacterium]|nr:ABC transporter substrate-binding protein [Chloroflexota bacterium]